MLKRLMTSCGSAEVALSRRDAIIGALALLGGSILFVVVGFAAKSMGYEVMGEMLLSIAFPASLLFSMPFTYLKGRCWRTQLLLVGLPLLLLVLACFLAQLI